MSTEIECKSDCVYSQTKDRRCKLGGVTMAQTSIGPAMVCHMYEATNKENMSRVRGIHESMVGKMK